MSYLFQLIQNRALAEDLTQETFLKVYRARSTYVTTSKFSTWLWTIARNSAFDQMDKKIEKLAASDEPVDLDLGSATPNAEIQLIQAAEQKRVESCMGKLSLAQREALTLRTVSELSYEEIAHTLGGSLSAVKSLIFRAKDALIACLSQGVSDD